MEERGWDHGRSEQADPCWIVLEHAPSNTEDAIRDSTPPG